jgi:hypothetical protein
LVIQAVCVKLFETYPNPTFLPIFLVVEGTSPHSFPLLARRTQGVTSLSLEVNLIRIVVLYSAGILPNPELEFLRFLTGFGQRALMVKWPDWS